MEYFRYTHRLFNELGMLPKFGCQLGMKLTQNLSERVLHIRVESRECLVDPGVGFQKLLPILDKPAVLDEGFQILAPPGCDLDFG